MSDHSSETKQASAEQYPPTELSQTLNRTNASSGTHKNLSRGGTFSRIVVVHVVVVVAKLQCRINIVNPIVEEVV